MVVVLKQFVQCAYDIIANPDEMVELYKKRTKLDDAEAIYNLGCCYADEGFGLTQNVDKALELWHRAADLGNAKSYYSIGNSYYAGNGVERDNKKAKYYWELAAMGGDWVARYNLGCTELRAGNMDRALKHLMITAGSGNTDSLKAIQALFMDGLATKDDYAKALRVYQAYLNEIKSPQRDQAAAFDDQYKYY